MAKVNELSGEVFGSLTVEHRNKSNKRGRAIWHVKCKCGNELDVLGNSLLTGNTTSCGCVQKIVAASSMELLHKKQWSNKEFVNYKKQDMKERFTTHGARSRENIDPLYSIWRGMKVRCKRTSSYVRKHIKVCTEWETSFETFKDWSVINNYVKGKHLDRTDNSGNYEPGNCRFLTAEAHRKKSGEEVRKFFKERREKNEQLRHMVKI